MCAISVRGMGIISSLGRGKRRTVKSIQLEKDGMSRAALFPNPGIEEIPVCEVSDFAADTIYRPDALAAVSIAEALGEAGLSSENEALSDCALVLGITTIDLLEWEEKFRKELRAGKKDPRLIVGQGAGAGRVASRLAKNLGIRGPVLTFSTGCTSSANALYQGMRLLQSDRVKRVLVVGVDSLTTTSLYGFASLALLDSSGCRPFDKNRGGLLIGEGAGAVLIEREHLSQDSDQNEWPTLLSAMSVCDLYHPTTFSPDGSQGGRVMNLALESAGIGREQVAAVKAHGTGSRESDRAEAMALRLVFGSSVPPFISLKRYFGHTMGAAGVLELVAFLSCVQSGFIPATLGFSEEDAEIEIRPTGDHQTTAGGIYLLNYFGFGGSCVSLVAKVPQR